jgi:RHS repeat-associated protein
VRQTLTDTGSASTPLHYDPWGTPTEGTPPTFGFTGELQDATSGLVHLRARWYLPAQGAFASRDPFAGFPAQPYSLHPYQYGYSNPILYTDPSGWCSVLARLLGCTKPHPTWTSEDLVAFEDRHPYPYKDPVAQLPGVSHHTPAQAEAYAQAYAAFVANPRRYTTESDTYTYAAIFAEDYLHTTLIPDHLEAYLAEWECWQQKANSVGLTEDEAWQMFYVGGSIGLMMPGGDRLMAPFDRDGGGGGSGKWSSKLIDTKHLSPKEYKQAQEIVETYGGQFKGQPKKNFRGIDGWINGVPASLKIYSGNRVGGVLSAAGKAEMQARQSGYTGVKVFIEAKNVPTDRLIDFATSPPGNLAKISQGGTVSSIHIRTSGGWIDIDESGTVLLRGR